jgi:hypothetical protein
MGTGAPDRAAFPQEVIADFTGDSLPIPPGVESVPTFVDDIPRPAWLSPVAGNRLRNLGDTSGHLVVGGRTVWVQSSPTTPLSLIAAHPNRLGSSEDLPAMVALARRLGATAYIEVDPLLAGVSRIPPEARPTVHWPDSTTPAVTAAAFRAQQGAEALRRRLTQLKGLVFPVEHPYGRTITVILPVPADPVVSDLSRLGASLNAAEFWEGGVSMTVGWWHTRRQLDLLTAALGALISEGSVPPEVPPDRFDRIPDDLPLRRLDSIPSVPSDGLARTNPRGPQ